ncbi:MAG: endo-1,4-beta-xylanase [Candidatus Abyssubacteria bacterium]|nr:endo-1,4-beta-xylanase [Candidatus Abyssubacteria bacterium]
MRTREKTSASLIFLLMVVSCAPTSRLSLRSLAPVHGIEIGSAVAANPLRNDGLYGKTLAREFSMVTPMNAMKFESLHPTLNRYEYGDADAIVEFAAAHGMKVRGHTLVWHEQLPPEITEGNWTRDELTEILREHIMTVVGRYRGRVAAWDVVSEAIDDDASLRDTIWSRGIGPEYIAMAFRWAHEADPDALLFYNDYGGEGLSDKSDAIYALARDLLQRGVPIHGVGLEMHVGLDWFPEPETVAANMKRLAALGLQVHITEMDVKIKTPVTRKELFAQARVYRDMLNVCLSADNCTAFVIWGFTDRYSWVPGFFPGWDSALVFDKRYHPKPAYNRLLNVLVEP